MLLPIGHDNLRGRRWPWVTVVLIAINAAVFLATYSTIDTQLEETTQVESRLLILAKAHPELKMTQDAQAFVQNVEEKDPEFAAELSSGGHAEGDSENARAPRRDSPSELQSQMDTLCQQFSDEVVPSILWTYGNVPGASHLLSYLTSMFLHAGWLHLIGNMWFLWLAGTILEDTWGRLIYPAFYLLSGVAADVVHGVVNSGSMVPSLGASGAIAGLMGAFLVRFPKTKIRMMWLFLFKAYKFNVPAFTLLPLWLGMEFFSGVWYGATSGVAHWAHIGGFVAGVLAALAFRASGLEQKAEQAVTAKAEWWRTTALPSSGRPAPPWPR
ncbi:MAG TPA: rhomboid family intramembrane serine protease [Candidatus Acidoferrales bacterium]|nr:rhomboid family intramembrane serine protease [Candidatus Acidoferrales bacterium]